MSTPGPRRDPALTSRPASPVPPELVASGPTALRIVLGGQLRRLREAHGITCEAAGRVIRASASKISRLEHGRVSMKQRDLADLMTLYGVTGEAERADVLRLAGEAARPGWWQQYGEILPGWSEFYLGLEAAASRIRTYEMQFVPGLLQTPEYARAVIRGGHPAAPADEIARRISLRMKRQQILSRPDGPKLWAVVDETALRRRGVPGAADQRAVPGRAAGRGSLLRGHGPAERAGRAPRAHGGVTGPDPGPAHQGLTPARYWPYRLIAAIKWPSKHASP
jgi:transcriptional regulator with XRE-family HTH domain